MANSDCVGCGKPFTEVARSREHILPEWLAIEVEQPDLSLNQYRHNEDKVEDELLRSHDLGSFVIKNVCGDCNNGWMSRLEGRAKPMLLELMNMRASFPPTRRRARKSAQGVHCPRRSTSILAQGVSLCMPNRHFAWERSPNSDTPWVFDRSSAFCGRNTAVSGRESREDFGSSRSDMASRHGNPRGL